MPAGLPKGQEESIFEKFTRGACSAFGVVAVNCGFGCLWYMIAFVQLVGGTVTRLLNSCTAWM